ncbi:uncharacterized protein [Paramisgurnus dabryanus]|uniref:uncharacterized protein isoform X3 n=1 Tax=Paramisgurnus dabryanus TaxID=90735 RepID=UPI0031F45241
MGGEESKPVASSSRPGIPQVIVMTKIDEACRVVNKDLTRVYHSKKIKEKMQTCSDLIGVPMCNILPVKNYHEEMDTNPDVDVLILKALEQIVNLAQDRIDSSSSCIQGVANMGGGASKPVASSSPPVSRPVAPPPQPEFNEPWRKIDWNQRDVLKKKLEEFTLSNEDVKYIKILVAGEIGAGKSSFINSINSVFQERISSMALFNSSAGYSKRFTTKLKSSCIKSGHKFLPYVFTDVMGLDSKALGGSLPEDIVSAVFGHVKDGYKFDESKPIAQGDEHYISDPNLSDQAFCLVYIIAADKLSFTDEKLIDKLKIIRSRISDRGIPQVIVMTKIDEACPVVKKDLTRVYHSKKIKEKMQMCSSLIGVPMCNILPVKNYHEEMDTNPDVDFLILKALEQIVNLAQDRIDSSSSCIQGVANMGVSESKPKTPPQPEPELNEPWRKFDWNQRDVLKKKLEEFTLSNEDVKYIKILVAGEIGAGKSSFINSVNSVFRERITSIAPVSSSAGQSKSLTTKLKSFRIKSGHKFLPYVFTDIMGLESETLGGSLPEDIVSAVFGHVKDGYKFDESEPIAQGKEHYISDPNLSDQAFCLVYIIAADKLSFTDEKLIDKLKIIRSRISDRDIPQVIVMTKVDEACPAVKENLRKVFHSKKIKEKMQTCSDSIGVPMSNIFPVKNYHDETETNPDVDVLILKALDQIFCLAEDRLDSSSW